LTRLALAGALAGACATSPDAGGRPVASAADRAERSAAGARGETGSTRAAPRYAFLVRHAEKDPAIAEDPPLTAAGHARARALADRLGGERIVRLYASDTRRARDTAAPLAERLGLRVQLYDPRRLADLAGELRWMGDNVLVVGHSNTTDELARQLGGDGGPPIADDEYDRLYRVDLETGETLLERY
jgi:broad specificity phosphatase PhoE